MAAEKSPLYETRSKTDLNTLLFSKSIRSYSLIIDGQNFPGVIMMGQGNIFFNDTPIFPLTKENLNNSCIQLISRYSFHPKYKDEYVLYLHSFYDTSRNKECHAFYKNKGISHDDMFNIFGMLANQIGIDRIELYDGSSIHLPNCKWNLRILNRLLQSSTVVPQHKSNPQTFYGKFGFQQYDKIDIFRRIPNVQLTDIMHKYIRKYEIPIANITSESALIEIVKHMHAKCSGDADIEYQKEYEELKKDIIELLDKSLTADLYYIDVDKTQMLYTFTPSNYTIELTTIPEGGRKKSKKTRKRKNKSRKF